MMPFSNRVGRSGNIMTVAFQVHPTEACGEPRIEVFQGMSPVFHDLIKNRARRTEIHRGPSAPWAHRFCRKTLATEISLVEWHLCRARLRFFRLALSTSIPTQAPISLDTGVMPGKPPAHASAGSTAFQSFTLGQFGSIRCSSGEYRRSLMRNWSNRNTIVRRNVLTTF